MADLSALSSRTVKVTYDGETRRGQLSVSAGASLEDAFETIQNTVAILFEMSVDGMWLKYADEEGDLCTLTEHSLTDLVAISPSGILRFTLEIREPVLAAPEPMCVDDVNCSATAASAGQSTSEDPAATDALRAKVRELLKVIPAGVGGVALNFVRGMQPEAIKGILGMIAQQTSMHPEQIRAHLGACGEDADTHLKQVADIIPELLDMEPGALKTLAVEELQALNAPAGNMPGSCESPNPLETMIGALLGGANMPETGEGTSPDAAPAPNLLGQLMSGFLFRKGKGAGKGDGATGMEGMGAECPGTSNCWQGGHSPNLMHQMIHNFMAKGAGKGKGYGPTHAEARVTKCASGHPLHRQVNYHAVCDVCGKAGTSFRCNAGCDWDACENCGAEATTETGDSCAAATHVDNRPDDVVPDVCAGSRDAFTESVNELVEMGVVPNHQMARELLTKHGDVSSVVSALFE